MIDGTALTQVAARCATTSQKPVRWKRSSSTMVPPETRGARRPTTSPLTWVRGRELNPRSAGPSSYARATARATWSSWASSRRMALRGPVDPELNSRQPPSAAVSPWGRPCTGAPIGIHETGSTRTTGRAPTGGSSSVVTASAGRLLATIAWTASAGAFGSSGTTVAPTLIRLTKRVPKATGSVVNRPTRRPERPYARHCSTLAASSARSTTRSLLAASSHGTDAATAACAVTTSAKDCFPCAGTSPLLSSASSNLRRPAQRVLAGGCGSSVKPEPRPGIPAASTAGRGATCSRAPRWVGTQRLGATSTEENRSMLLYLGILSPFLAFPALMLLDRLEQWTAQPSPRSDVRTRTHVMTAVVENPAMTSHQPTHVGTSSAA